jgi:hypothetical protein
MGNGQTQDSGRREEAPRPAYISLAQAAKLLPSGRSGRPVHVATLGRWIATGCRTSSGEIIRLEAVRMGSRP